MNEYSTVHEVAERLRVSPMTIYRLVQQGELPSVTIGRSIRVLWSGVEEYLQEHRT